MTKSAKRKRVILISLGCCCLIAAAALGVYNRWSENRASAEADKLTSAFAAMLEASPADTGEIQTGVDPGLEDTKAGEEQMDYITVDGHDICGSVSIPSLEIELAVILEWSYPNLNVTACRYSGTPKSQLIIIAHNYRKHFGYIKELEPGDIVEFTDVKGNVYTYEVYTTETWATNQLTEIISGDEWDLTLFTCTYGGANRVVVRCAKVGGQAAAQ